MAYKISVSTADARNDAIESQWGASPLLWFYSGSIPANCAAAASGTKIAAGTLPADPMAASSANSKTKQGVWTVTGLAAAGTGTAADYFRIMDSAGTTCHGQGSLTVTGGGGVMTLDNVSIAESQVVTVNTFTIADGNV